MLEVDDTKYTEPTRPGAAPTNRAGWLSPPLVRLLLHRVLCTVVIGASFMTLVTLVLGHRRTAVLGAIAVGIVGALVLLGRWGHTRGASIAACLGLLALAGYAMASANGLNDSAIVILPGVFILTNILLGPRWLFIVTVLASLITLGIAHAEITGLLVTPLGGRLRYVSAFEVLVILWVTAITVHYVVSTLGQALADTAKAHASARAVFDAVNEAILIHDPETGVVLDANETTLHMYGVGKCSVIGMNLEDLSSGEPPYDRAHAMAHVKRAIEAGPQSFPWRSKRASGELFWTEVSLRYATVESEPRILAVVRDVSERRELERRVQEAEKLTAVGRLAGGVAHDFNNQLVGIIGNAEFLRRRLPAQGDDRLRQSVDAILDSGERAADLTRQLLAFARKGRDRALAVDLHRLIVEVVALIEHSIDKRINIERDLRAERAVTLGDPSALQNALLNLAINARDAMPEGGRLRFATENTEVTSAQSVAAKLAPGRYVRVSVSDTGTGMAPEVARHAFEPFFTTKDSGTGMGLAAVYGTVREHEGSVELDTEPGRGTIFTLYLPLTTQDPVPSAQAPGATLRAERGRVMVVDDEPAVANVAREVLSGIGYEVDVCEGGRAALERFGPDRYDLVLLDITMPDVDGVEILHRMRQLDPRVRVLLMTGHASDIVRERLRGYPDVRILSKPFSNERLASAVRRTLRAEPS